MSYRITGHAREEMQRRGISETVLSDVMLQPDQTVPGHHGRLVRQKRRLDGSDFLVRAVIETANGEAVVITVYRSRRIERYWRAS